MYLYMYIRYDLCLCCEVNQDMPGPPKSTARPKRGSTKRRDEGPGSTTVFSGRFSSVSIVINSD